MKQYKTESLAQAAYLLYHKAKFLGVEMRGKMGTFSFEDVNDFLIEQYDLGQGQVEPQQFHELGIRLAKLCKRKNQERT